MVEHLANLAGAQPDPLDLPAAQPEFLPGETIGCVLLALQLAAASQVTSNMHWMQGWEFKPYDLGSGLRINLAQSGASCMEDCVSLGL